MDVRVKPEKREVVKPIVGGWRADNGKEPARRARIGGGALQWLILDDYNLKP